MIEVKNDKKKNDKDIRRTIDSQTAIIRPLFLSLNYRYKSGELANMKPVPVSPTFQMFILITSINNKA